MIQVRHDSERGCGWRKGGGLYLVSENQSVSCGRFPIPLTFCPTCKQGIHPARGWTWIDADVIVKSKKCENNIPLETSCECPLADEYELGMCGLIWIGEKFYKSPSDFSSEAVRLGISRRITSVPRKFEIGKTRVFLAHQKCIPNPDGTFCAGIFYSFVPTAIEYVVRGDETQEEIDSLEKRGITPVKIEKALEPTQLFEITDTQ